MDETAPKNFWRLSSTNCDFSWRINFLMSPKRGFHEFLHHEELYCFPHTIHGCTVHSKNRQKSIRAMQVTHLPAGDTILVLPTLVSSSGMYLICARSHHSLTTWLNLKRHTTLVVSDLTIDISSIKEMDG